jgi:hypothetical protein
VLPETASLQAAFPGFEPMEQVAFSLDATRRVQAGQ